MRSETMAGDVTHRSSRWALLATGFFTASVLVAGGVLGQDTTAAGRGRELVFPLSEKTFERYGVPGECAWAQEWLENMYWRDHRPDTVFHGPEGNPYQPATQEKIRGCASRYAPADVAERDLIGLAQASLDDGELDKADAALTRLTARSASPSGRAWTYYQAVDVLLSAPQPQIERAQAYLAKLDAMGAEGAVERMLGHTELASEAQRRDSVPLWDSELQAAEAASKQITGDTRKEYAFEEAAVYAATAELKARENDVAGARAALTAGRTDLLPLRPMVGMVFSGAERWYALQGQNPGPVQVTKWVLKGMPGKVHPVSGKPAVIMFVSSNCGGRCYGDYAVVRRLIAKFPATDLDVLFITHTEGYARGRLVPPDSEMVGTEDYFINYLQMPVNLGLWEANFTRRADQRLMMEVSPVQRAYDPPMAGDITIGIIDKSGVLRMYTTLSSHNEAMLNDVIKSVM